MDHGQEAIQLLRKIRQVNPDMWEGTEADDDCSCWRHSLVRLLAKIDGEKTEPSWLDIMI